MGKREAKQQLKRLQRVKTWQLLVVFVILLFVSATFLRLNNIGMMQRREAVLSADQQSDETVLFNRVYDLQRYSAAHMNATTGVVPLQASYDRAAEKLKAEAEAEVAGSENIYNKIEEEVCGPRAIANGWRWPDAEYIACQRAELAKYPAAERGSGDVTLPNASLYQHSFISPLWSPDFAGFSVLATGLVGLAILLRLISEGVLRLLVRYHYRSV